MFGKDGKITEKVDGKTARMMRLSNELESELNRRKNIRVVCPWCLNATTADKFTQINYRTYKPYKTFVCSECGQRMKESTAFIVDKLGPEGYSEWLWENVFSFKAYEKVKWEILKERVRDMGFEDVFWETWRTMKGSRR
jgi:hypothetical protein